MMNVLFTLGNRSRLLLNILGQYSQDVYTMTSHCNEQPILEAYDHWNVG